MKANLYITVSALIFLVVALVHLLRVTQGWPVLVGTFSIPVWASVLAVLLSAGVAVWGLSLLRRHH